MTVHLGIPVPQGVRGTTKQEERAFREAFFVLDRWISLFLGHLLASLARVTLAREIDRIDNRRSKGC